MSNHTTPPSFRNFLAAVAVVLAALAATASPAAARDDSITSFDGTKIALSFFPAAGLQPGQKAPTVLLGHGWGQSRDTNENSTTLDAFGVVGVGPLRAAGYNVLTWDARGFGQSGGTVEVDSPDYEARDASALIDYVARQPEAQLDRPGDPRVGMTGIFLSLSRVLPDRYPLGDDVDTYVAVEHGFGHMLDIGVIQPRLGHLYTWSAEELALPGLRALLNGQTPTYAWDVADADTWQFEPSLLARAVRRMVPASTSRR